MQWRLVCPYGRRLRLRGHSGGATSQFLLFRGRPIPGWLPGQQAAHSIGLFGRSTRFRSSRRVQGSSPATPHTFVATTAPYAQPFRRKPCVALHKPEHPSLHENGSTRRESTKGAFRQGASSVCPGHSVSLRLLPRFFEQSRRLSGIARMKGKRSTYRLALRSTIGNCAPRLRKPAGDGTEPSCGDPIAGCGGVSAGCVDPEPPAEMLQSTRSILTSQHS